MAYGTANTSRYFDTGQVDLTSANAKYKVVDLRGGEAVVIKALVGNAGNVYIGTDDLSSSVGFELSPGESIKIEYLPDKEAWEHITLYALAASAGDDVCYIMVP